MFEEMKEELRDILDVPEGEALLPELAKTVACSAVIGGGFMAIYVSANMQDFCPAFFIFHFDIHISF